jgi:hypothetical protein
MSQRGDINVPDPFNFPKKRLAIAVVLLLSCAPVSVQAGVIGTIESSFSGTASGALSSLDFWLCYPAVRPDSSYDLSVSLRWTCTPSEAGTTLGLAAISGGDFLSFVALLTNGVDDSFYVSESPVVPFGGVFPFSPNESTQIQMPGQRVDLLGYTIDEISLTVNSFSLTVSQASSGMPSADFPISSTQYAYDITYTIYGEPVPEPATLLLLGLGGIALRGRRSRQL